MLRYKQLTLRGNCFNCYHFCIVKINIYFVNVRSIYKLPGPWTEIHNIISFSGHCCCSASSCKSNLENTLKVRQIMYLNGFTNAKSIYIVRSDSSEVLTTTNIIFYKLARHCSLLCSWSVLFVGTIHKLRGTYTNSE